MSGGYFVLGADDQWDYVEPEDIDSTDDIEDTKEEPVNTPKWAIAAGKLFWCLMNPPHVVQGWAAFAKADKGEKMGNPYLSKVRQAIRKIARRLQQRLSAR